LRALCEAGLHVLALDSNSSQTDGAERRRVREERISRHAPVRNKPILPNGSVTHKTVLITSHNLESAISDWIANFISNTHSESTQQDRGPVLVLFVALHACGTLTPDILRTFISQHKALHSLRGSPHPEPQKWLPASAAIVGCCYNLMSPDGDFPLSARYSHLPPLSEPHLQLAAQVPAHWLDTQGTTTTAELAIPKMAYRALLEGYLGFAVFQDRERTSDAMHRRIGRLPDGAYVSFPHFLAVASSKLGFELPTHSSEGQTSIEAESSDWFGNAQRRLEVLHALRCVLGPAIESLIIADRVSWLFEALQGCDGRGPIWDVDLVNLFDQAMGSARNVAIVIRPKAA